MSPLDKVPLTVYPQNCGAGSTLEDRIGPSPPFSEHILSFGVAKIYRLLYFILTKAIGVHLEPVSPVWPMSHYQAARLHLELLLLYFELRQGFSSL